MKSTPGRSPRSGCGGRDAAHFVVRRRLAVGRLLAADQVGVDAARHRQLERQPLQRRCGREQRAGRRRQPLGGRRRRSVWPAVMPTRRSRRGSASSATSSRLRDRRGGRRRSRPGRWSRRRLGRWPCRNVSRSRIEVGMWRGLLDLERQLAGRDPVGARADHHQVRAERQSRGDLAALGAAGDGPRRSRDRTTPASGRAATASAGGDRRGVADRVAPAAVDRGRRQHGVRLGRPRRRRRAR